jgi:hypothetical protein
LTILCFVSCDPDNSVAPQQKGALQFSFSNSSLSTGRSKGDAQPAYALISITDGNNKSIYSNKEIPLYPLGDKFLSGNIELASSSLEYKLTDFVILDSNRKSIFISPKEGSAKANLVDDPLPIYFKVTASNTTSVVPQVLAVTNDSTPEEFGYVSFGFEVVSIPCINILGIKDYSVEKITCMLINPKDTFLINFNDSESSLIIPSQFDKQLWSVTITIFTNTKDCFKKVYRYQSGMTFSGKTIDLPQLIDPLWEVFYYSKYSIGLKSVEIYRSTDPGNTYAEVHLPGGCHNFYGYIDRGYEDDEQNLVCNMEYLVINNSPDDVVIINFPYFKICNGGYEYVDSLIVLDLSCLGYIEDYFRWNLDGSPSCTQSLAPGRMKKDDRSR